MFCVYSDFRFIRVYPPATVNDSCRTLETQRLSGAFCEVIYRHSLYCFADKDHGKLDALEYHPHLPFAATLSEFKVWERLKSVSLQGQHFERSHSSSILVDETPE